jgi:hypothetical protein
MLLIEFWIVRRGEDPWTVAPEAGDAISRHRHRSKTKCLFCGDGPEIAAVMAFCWREPDARIYTAGICMVCEAKHSDEELAEMTQQEVFPERVADVLALEEVAIELEAEGIVETVGIDPISGQRRRRLTAKGRERAELEAQAEDATKH